MRSWILAGHSCWPRQRCEQQRRDPDYQIVWGARHGGASDHVSIAVLAKDARGADPVGSSA
jgi:hypothetical protein